RREPRAAEHAAGVAHGIVARALIPCAAPIRHRRAVDHDRTRVVGIRRGKHHRRPSALAIADDCGLWTMRMQFAHLAHELLFRLAYTEQRLSRLRIAEEDDEIDRMAFAQRHADLRIVLEAADARPVTGARVDDHIRPALRIDYYACGWND